LALTFGTYVHPGLARPIGIAAVATLTAVNYRGVEKTAQLTRVIVVVVAACDMPLAVSNLAQVPSDKGAGQRGSVVRGGVEPPTSRFRRPGLSAMLTSENAAQRRA